MSEPTDENRVVVEGGTVVTPDTALEGGRVVLDGDQILAVDAPADSTDQPTGASRRVDATGQVVLPGLIDLHGDDVERYLYPRSGERVDTRMALAAADRLTMAAGVTTKFDAIAFEDAPEKNRSIEGASELLETVAADEGLLADHRVHARCEVTDAASVAAVGDLADRPVVDVVSLMAHAPGRGQFADETDFASRYADGRGAATDEAARVGRERRDVTEATVRERVADLATDLASTDVLLATHDDGDPAAVDDAVDHGVELCEYPVSLAAARRATDRGAATAMGAPNLVRGGSLWGNLDAREAIDAGVVDLLCSDYRPQALLASVFVDTGEPLERRVARVTSEPAAVAGLDDRGTLSPGARADLVVVDPDPVPTVSRAFVAGEEVYRCQ
ncbi:alpha-D-ribose 1-methylphosphonate 5-triphosphate diphosphatase [Halosimplex salinum]|uniref:alpha-D-ribose 1-methylphosphonate 5-triphosphate diphosphatase n=1 Tax=Halosimplex salinum TaxID=1710538 RepID=UPI000F477913|nr:alpha-D-ribose 1-methylphosphonate 5-triphosphate diphosphatase [Halosimplex salinum]